MAAALSGTAVRTVEVGSTITAARKKAPRVKLRGGTKSAQRPVITTMTVTIGLAFLDAWLVEKKALPERRFFGRLAVLGFVLALMAEVTPRLGKGMSYLVLTGVVFDRSQSILRELNYATKTTYGKQPGSIDPLKPPFTPDTTPITLYQRQGPLTTEPLLPAGRQRNIRPQRGAWATGQSRSSPRYGGQAYPLETA